MFDRGPICGQGFATEDRRTSGLAAVTSSRNRAKIWVDLDNSPHVPFFAPIVEQLVQSGYSVFTTARDCFQVCELADLLQLKYCRIGRHYGKKRLLKLAGVCWRASQLLPLVRKEKPDLALSHGSRSQLVVANLLGIPSVTIADYEFAKIWMFVRPTWVIIPEVIPTDALRFPKNRILNYPGIKEDVYVPRFTPDSSTLAFLGTPTATDIRVVIRPPATEAHYHRPASDLLFATVMDFLGKKPQVKIVLLPRNERQAAEIRARWLPLFGKGQVRIPDRVTDGLNLIWHSDLVISGGGTMNREAAALGVPVYSIFRGEIGAVDRYLASTGRLTLIEHPEDVPSKLMLVKRCNTQSTVCGKNITLKTIVEHVMAVQNRRSN